MKDIRRFRSVRFLATSKPSEWRSIEVDIQGRLGNGEEPGEDGTGAWWGDLMRGTIWDFVGHRSMQRVSFSWNTTESLSTIDEDSADQRNIQHALGWYSSRKEHYRDTWSWPLFPLMYDWCSTQRARVFVQSHPWELEFTGKYYVCVSLSVDRKEDLLVRRNTLK